MKNKQHSEAEAIKWAAYRNTTFRAYVHDQHVDIKIGYRHPLLDEVLLQHKATSWAFITASNPAGQCLPDRENIRRDEELSMLFKTISETTKVVKYDGEGIPDTGDWKPEKSYLVIGITHPEARSLGKKFGQDAIVWGSAGKKARLVSLVQK